MINNGGIMEEPKYIPGHIPTKERKLSQAFANACAWILSQRLTTSTFYFTYCHAGRSGHIDIVPRKKCAQCNSVHPCLPLDRSAVKELANGRIPEEVEKFIDNQIKIP